MAPHKIKFRVSNESDHKKRWKRRNEIRMRVIREFAKEEPGEGSGKDASKYFYKVEKLKGGKRIYLQRPTRNFGFDFLILIGKKGFADLEKKQGRYAPTHKDLLDDLSRKKERHPKKYAKLYGLMKKIYHCHDVKDKDMDDIQFNSGWSTDQILKTLKWFFIEQDICYWNYSGRKMLWNEIPEP